MMYGNQTVFQTMLNLSAITIKKDDYPEGICVVLLSKISDDDCFTGESKCSNPNKTFHVSNYCTLFISPKKESKLFCIF